MVSARQVEQASIWSALLVYAFVWFACTSFGFHSGLQLHGLAVTTAYVGAHVYEIRWRGHCFLSADSTALPAALLVGLASLTAHALLGRFALLSAQQLESFLAAQGAAFVLGHLAAMAWAAALGWWLEKRGASRDCRSKPPHPAAGDGRAHGG